MPADLDYNELVKRYGKTNPKPCGLGSLTRKGHAVTWRAKNHRAFLLSVVRARIGIADGLHGLNPFTPALLHPQSKSRPACLARDWYRCRASSGETSAPPKKSQRQSCAEYRNLEAGLCRAGSESIGLSPLEILFLSEIGMAKRLTKRQMDVLNFMHAYFQENDQLPSCRAIAIHFGFRSENASKCFQNSLEAGVWIEKNAAGKYRFAKAREEVAA